MNDFYSAPEGLAVMCHPGYPDPRTSLNHLIDARKAELAYLLSEEFTADLERASMRLGRFRDLPRATHGDKSHAPPIKPQI
jgi:predicted glycoside hydrolase/deacetylase ChbG (UPF0249 family)